MKLKINELKYQVLLVSDDGKSAIVQYQHIPVGLSSSIGNAIRRTLLSYIPGYAPICYTFSLDSENTVVDTIPNIKEDVYQVSNNIAGLQLKCLCPDYIEEFYLTYSGIIDKSLKARNLVPKGELPKEFQTNIPTEYQHYVENGVFNTDKFYQDNVKVMNPEHLILTNGKSEPITKNLIIKCNTGVYFTTSLDREKIDGLGDKYIVVQSIYNPIVHAHFQVLPEGNSKFTETLELTVETDGSISPFDAISSASSLLTTMFTIFSYNQTVSVQPQYYDFSQPEETNTQPTIKEDIIIQHNPLTEDLIEDPVIYNALKIMGLNDKESIFAGIQSGDIKRFFEKSNIPYNEKELKSLLDKANVTGIVKIDG